MTDFEYEKNKLTEILEKYGEIVEDTEQFLYVLPKKYRDDPMLLNNLMQQYHKKYYLLKEGLKKPYFARIDFKDDEDKKIEQCYIGKVGVSDYDNKIITVDWRAPIASIYYDSNIGNASYEAPQGIITGQLLVKRQFDIENGILNGYQDVDTVSNDEILKPYLGVTADNRLKNIIASIQSEQNEIIREKLNKNLIIQGVAGSGKTTVALHRIAYLVYNHMDKIKPEQYMVVGPNKFFLNYISSVLPDLDVNNVDQLTFDELVSDFIGEDFALNSVESKLVFSLSSKIKMPVERYKTSMAFKEAIDKYMGDFDKGVVPVTDFSIKSFTILPHSVVKEVYDEIDKNQYKSIKSRIERACLMLSAIIERNSENILSSINASSYKLFDASGGNKNKIEKLQKDVDFVKKEIKNCCNQSLKKYFTKLTTKTFTMYSDFIKRAEKYVDLDKLNIEYLKENTITNIKTKSIDFEDLAALLYLKFKLLGFSKYKKYRHVVIDEAQDYGEFNFYVLNQIMPNCTFSIFGDLAQSIYDYRSIDNWNDVVKHSFSDKCDVKELLISYRTTVEIMKSANLITDHIGLNNAEPVIRHGQNVGISQYQEDKIGQIIEKISDFVEKGYKSIAIISKTAEERNFINQKLLERGVKLQNVISTNTAYKGGICTITNYLVKGLEFDAVLISNASELEYSSDKVLDMKLLYVAMTRPLHELEIMYSDELTKPLKRSLIKDNVENIKIGR